MKHDSDRPTDPAPPPATSDSQQLRAVRPLEHVIRDMSERTLAMSERLTELATCVNALAESMGELRSELRSLVERVQTIERRFSNGAEAP